MSFHWSYLLHGSVARMIARAHACSTMSQLNFNFCKDIYHQSTTELIFGDYLAMGTSTYILVPANQLTVLYHACLQVENCRLSGLPDLDQSHDFVRSTLKDWVRETVSTYGLDGIRIDTVPEVPKDFWKEYGEAAGVYQLGEALNGDPYYLAGYQGSLDAVFNYKMYYSLKDAFGQSRKTMRNIHDGIEVSRNAFSDVSVLGNFVDNHDNDRFLHNNDDWSVLKNALAYVIFAEVLPYNFHVACSPICPMQWLT